MIYCIERPDGSLGIHIDIPPVPASRPRVGRWGTYYGKTYKAWREAIAEAIETWELKPLSGPLFVETWIFAKRPKTTKREWPRGDLDNFLKAVWDGLNGTVWVDDDQIVDESSHKRFSDEPCVIMIVYPLETLDE